MRHEELAKAHRGEWRELGRRRRGSASIAQKLSHSNIYIVNISRQNELTNITFEPLPFPVTVNHATEVRPKKCKK